MLIGADEQMTGACDAAPNRQNDEDTRTPGSECRSGHAKSHGNAPGGSGSVQPIAIIGDRQGGAVVRRRGKRVGVLTNPLSNASRPAMQTAPLLQKLISLPAATPKGGTTTGLFELTL